MTEIGIRELTSEEIASVHGGSELANACLVGGGVGGFIGGFTPFGPAGMAGGALLGCGAGVFLYLI